MSEGTAVKINKAQDDRRGAAGVKEYEKKGQLSIQTVSFLLFFLRWTNVERLLLMQQTVKLAKANQRQSHGLRNTFFSEWTGRLPLRGQETWKKRCVNEDMSQLVFNCDSAQKKIKGAFEKKKPESPNILTYYL